MLASITCSTLLALGTAAPPATPAKPAAAPTRPEKTAAKKKAAADEPERRGDRELNALLRKVQRFYDRMQDFEAEFIQTYTRKALSRTIESSGVLTLKKGGKVHWQYARPAEKLFVANGETLWIYEPEVQQVIVDRSFSTEKLGGSLAFLWGAGSLRDSFEVKRVAAEAHGFEAGAAVLELVPKRDRTYRKLLVRIDPKSGRVEESVVHETAGNTNRFLFRDPKVNQDVPDTKFEFVPPAGVDVVEARPS